MSILNGRYVASPVNVHLGPSHQLKQWGMEHD